MEKNKDTTNTLERGGREQGLLRLHQLGLGKQFLDELKSFLCRAQREDELLVKGEVGPGRRGIILGVSDCWYPEIWFSFDIHLTVLIVNVRNNVPS